LWLRDYGILLLVFILMINAVQNCSQSTKLDKNAKEIKANAMRIDSINYLLSAGVYLLPKDELTLMLEIQRLQTAKLVLYDWNTVVRTTVRPDDRMNEYDVEIAKVTKELLTLRQNKGTNDVKK
jgi:hypothetical protein